MSEIYPIDKEKKEVFIIYADDLATLVEQVYDNRIPIKHLYLNIFTEIFTEHDVIPRESREDEMNHLDTILDDLCGMGHLEEGTYFIKYDN